MDFWLYYTLALLLICGGGLCWLSNLFSLPGNWILLGLAAVSYTHLTLPTILLV